MTPDHRDIVEQVDREFPDLLRSNTIESCGRFTRLCAARLHERDPNWGLLTKRPGQTQYDGYAVDAIIYKASEQVVDIIGGAHNPPHAGRPAWSLVGRDPSNQWARPVDVGASGSTDPADAGAPPPACTCDLRPFEAELATLRAAHEALGGECGVLRAEVRALVSEVEALKAAWNQPWHVRGGTSRDAYHSHQIDLVVSRES